VYPRRGWRSLRMYYACPKCRVVYGRESGYFTGAMFVSYALAIPLFALLYLVIALVTGWGMEIVLLLAALYFIPFAPALFRYSRVIWMHFDRVVDPNPESETYAAEPPRSERESEG
jgi:hypothetical protein